MTTDAPHDSRRTLRLLLDREWKRAEMLESRVQELEAALAEAVDAVIWMSGSGDFAPDGQAGNAWSSIRDVQLPRWRALTSSAIDHEEDDRDG